jgi:protein-arginine kinase activator protein McsA
MITRELIIEAYLFLRKNNQSIPDETLDFIKHSALEALANSSNDIQNVIVCPKCDNPYPHRHRDNRMSCEECGNVWYAL